MRVQSEPMAPVSDDSLKQAVFDEPTIPRKPLRHDPQVLETVSQGDRCKVSVQYRFGTAEQLIPAVLRVTATLFKV